MKEQTHRSFIYMYLICTKICILYVYVHTSTNYLLNYQCIDVLQVITSEDKNIVHMKGTSSWTMFMQSFFMTHY